MIFAAVALMALAPSPLLACAACYGKSDSPLASGMNWAIFTMMGVLLPVLGCFGFCFIRMINKDEASGKDKDAPKNITDL
jgi:heme/copper-type cytochrome/quinol oxidase subunit 2